jgi:HD-like signal output (HDOD) protein
MQPKASLEDRILRTLERVDQDLPTIPVVLSRIMHLTTSDNTSIRDLIEVLNQDQALTARMLRVANSVYYSLREKVTTLERAVVVLGFDMVRSLAVGASFIRYFTPRSKHSGFDLNAFWTHTTAVGVFSENLAREFRFTEPADAFTAGILHDIGKLFLLIYFQEDFERTLNRLSGGRLDFFEAEMAEHGLDHAGVAGFFLEHWRIPSTLTSPIRCHHGPLPPGPEAGLAAVIGLADYAARYFQIGSSGSPYLSPPQPEMLHAFGLTAAGFQALLELLAGKRTEVFKLISALD